MAKRVFSKKKAGVMKGGYFTKAKCQKRAANCRGRADFRSKHCHAYNVSKKNGWLEEFFARRSKWMHKENCKKAALKCKTRTEFARKYPGAYKVSRQQGWMEDICSHMKPSTKPNGFWNKANCMEAALKCKTRNEFRNRFRGAWAAAKKNGWFEEICVHMSRYDRKWTKAACKKEALKYKRRSDFNINASGAYRVSRLSGWLDEFFPKK